MSARMDVTVSLDVRGALVRYHCAHPGDRNSWRVQSPIGGGTFYFMGTNEQMRAFAAAILAEVKDRERVWLGEDVGNGA